MAYDTIPYHQIHESCPALLSACGPDIHIAAVHRISVRVHPASWQFIGSQLGIKIANHLGAGSYCVASAPLSFCIRKYCSMRPPPQPWLPYLVEQLTRFCSLRETSVPFFKKCCPSRDLIALNDHMAAGASLSLVLHSSNSSLKCYT